MMDDLISRKSVLDVLNDVDQDGLLKISQIIDFIEDQPTAFNKEKVIEKPKHLEKDTFDYYNRYNDEMAFGESAAFRLAIEIVEEGGIE